MTKVLGFLHKLEWVNKYGSPPDGVKILVEVFLPIDQEGCRQTPKEIEELMVPRLGYSHIVQAITEFPMETKATRFERMTQKMNENFPLFANQFIQEEVSRRKDYYQENKEVLLEEKRAAIKKGLRAMRLRQEANGYS